MPYKPLVYARNVDKMTRAEWLEARRGGIGGSDAAAVCGLSPWRSPLSVYLSKVGAAPETATTEAMTWGNLLETPIAEEFARRTGYRIRRSNMILQHPEHKFMLANLDRLVQEEEGGDWGVLEVKALGPYNSSEWQDGEVPAHYLTQLAHYLYVTGAKYAWIAPLIGGQKLAPVRVERDERLIKSLVAIERDFWTLVEKRQPPAIDDSLDASRVLKFLYPTSKATTATIPADLYTRLVAARQKQEDAEREVRLYQNQVQELLGEAEAGVVEGNPKPVVTWKGSTAKRLDVQALEVAEPELCAKYLKETPMRRFIVKAQKESQ